jgi:hypothetical protein
MIGGKTMEDASAARFGDLSAALIETIIATGSPRGHEISEDGTHGAEIIYDTSEVVSACTWVAANIVVQSGEYAPQRQRKLLADSLAKQFLAYCDEVDRMLAEARTMRPLYPS